MTDTVEIFYKAIKDNIGKYKESIINKNFVDASIPIQEIPINVAKGELQAVKQVEVILANLYKEYKANLNIIE